MNNILESLASTVGQATDLESLMRPLLELMETITGLESTYLTTIDLQRGIQHVLYARNTRELQIPEGLDVPWGDTLCKRALDEGRAFTPDVPACWGDSEAASALGIRTYLSQPVRNLDGSVYGTLCAAGGESVAIAQETIHVLSLFTRLITHQVETERHLLRLRCQNEELSTHAMLDPLTGVANRRGLMDRLERTLERARRDRGAVMLGFIDLDGFKNINDRHGHEAGDRFLCQIARKLAGSVRSGDFVGRYGGDEFVVIAADCEAGAFCRRLEQATVGTFAALDAVIEYPGASVGVAVGQAGECDALSLLARADAAMYSAKQARKSLTNSVAARH